MRLWSRHSVASLILCPSITGTYTPAPDLRTTIETSRLRNFCITSAPKNSCGCCGSKAADWSVLNPPVTATAKRTVASLASKLLGNARRRASKKGLEFTITKDWIVERLDAGVCQLSGLPLEIAQSKTANSPSLDRKDNSKGYTADNCQLITVQANSAKGEWPQGDLLIFCMSYIRLHAGSIEAVAKELTPYGKHVIQQET